VLLVTYLFQLKTVCHIFSNVGLYTSAEPILPKQSKNIGEAPIPSGFQFDNIRTERYCASIVRADGR
jgi:hypothetical protein